MLFTARRLRLKNQLKIKIEKYSSKCEECPYAIAGKLPTGNVLSLDKFKEMGVEILDKEFDLE